MPAERPYDAHGEKFSPDEWDLSKHRPGIFLINVIVTSSTLSSALPNVNGC